MAECHPVGFRWVMKAREKGATIIHVDPRFTRTSAVANIHVPIRAGSDTAFLAASSTIFFKMSATSASTLFPSPTHPPS